MPSAKLTAFIIPDIQNNVNGMATAKERKMMPPRGLLTPSIRIPNAMESRRQQAGRAACLAAGGLESRPPG